MRRLFVLAVVALLPLAGCLGRGEEAVGERYLTRDVHATASEGPLAIDLRVVRVGELHGDGANATLVVSADRPLEDVRAGISLGPGLHASERTWWSGALAPGEDLTLATDLRAATNGTWKVRAWAEAWVDGERFLAAREVFLGGDGTRSGVKEEAAQPALAPRARLEAVEREPGIVDLRGVFSVPADSSETRVLLVPPPGWEVDGDAEWRGATSAGREFTVEWTLVGEGAGNATMVVHADPSVTSRAGTASVALGQRAAPEAAST